MAASTGMSLNASQVVSRIVLNEPDADDIIKQMQSIESFTVGGVEVPRKLPLCGKYETTRAAAEGLLYFLDRLMPGARIVEAVLSNPNDPLFYPEGMWDAVMWWVVKGQAAGITLADVIGQRAKMTRQIVGAVSTLAVALPGMLGTLLRVEKQELEAEIAGGQLAGEEWEEMKEMLEEAGRLLKAVRRLEVAADKDAHSLGTPMHLVLHSAVKCLGACGQPAGNLEQLLAQEVQVKITDLSASDLWGSHNPWHSQDTRLLLLRAVLVAGEQAVVEARDLEPSSLIPPGNTLLPSYEGQVPEMFARSIGCATKAIALIAAATAAFKCGGASAILAEGLMDFVGHDVLRFITSLFPSAVGVQELCRALAHMARAFQSLISAVNPNRAKLREMLAHAQQNADLLCNLTKVVSEMGAKSEMTAETQKQALDAIRAAEPCLTQLRMAGVQDAAEIEAIKETLMRMIEAVTNLRDLTCMPQQQASSAQAAVKKQEAAAKKQEAAAKKQEAAVKAAAMKAQKLASEHMARISNAGTAASS